MTEQIDKDSMVLLSASYDGIQKKVFLKFYDEKTDTIKLWYCLLYTSDAADE